MGDKYVLGGDDGHTLVACGLIEWARWFETADRRVASTTIGDANVSTVFLGLDHQYGDGPPLVFETMVFGGAMDQEMDRYSTWDEAEAGHAAMCERVRRCQGGAA